jgi:hypothetical protein
MRSRRLRIQFVLDLFAVMFALWVFRLREGYVFFSGLLLLWLFFPVAAFALGFFFRRRPIAEAFFVLSALYCGVYAAYCLRGETGNNLPLLFVPLVLLVFSTLFVPVLGFYGWMKRKTSNARSAEEEYGGGDKN